MNLKEDITITHSKVKRIFICSNAVIKMTFKVSCPLIIMSNLYLNAQNQHQKPNIIFILADDLGYTDVNYFAHHLTGDVATKQYYETPNIDKLAKQGISFTQAYTSPLSAPTRASILTGKYAARLGFQTATGGNAQTFYAKGLTPPLGFHEQDCYWMDNITSPQALLNGHTLIALPSGQPQDNRRDEMTIAEALKDYHSAYLGKWHLGGHGSEGYQPSDQGFRELSYFDSGASTYFDWPKIWNRREKHFPSMRQNKLVQGKAVDSNIDYLTDDLTQQALDFIDEMTTSKTGTPFFLYFAHFAVHTPIQAPEETVEYFEDKETRGWKGQNNPVYAAMVKHLDISVGRIIEKLKEEGIDDNTIIIFTSDNGGIVEGKGDENFTTNSPLKGQKATVYEGGIRVPLIISYKGNIIGGKTCNIPVDCNDYFPTIMEFAGYPEPQHDIDGQSIVPLLSDIENKKENYKRDTFYWHYPLNVIYRNPDDCLPYTPHSAIRKGDYKLIFDWHGRLKLYNIKNDVSETTNLKNKEPQVVVNLFQDLISFLEENVERRYWPKFNPDYKVTEEIRLETYVDLYKTFKEGGNIVKTSN